MPPVFAVFSYTGRKPALWLSVCAGENRAMCLSAGAKNQRNVPDAGKATGRRMLFAFPGWCCGRVFPIFEKHTENIRKIITHGGKKVQRLRKKKRGRQRKSQTSCGRKRGAGAGNQRKTKAHEDEKSLPGGFCERNLRFSVRCGILFTTPFSVCREACSGVLSGHGFCP